MQVHCNNSVQKYPSPYLCVMVFMSLCMWLFALPTKANDKCILQAGFGVEAPYHFPDNTGKIIGIDAEILRQTLNDLGCSIEFVELPWKRTLTMIKNGMVDVTLGASFKEDRNLFAHYSVPYRGQPHVVFELSSNTSKAENLIQYLDGGRTLGVINGWHYTNKIQALIKDKKYKDQVDVAPLLENAMAMLEKGRFDGYIANPSQVAAIVGQDRFKSKYKMIKADVDILHFIFSRKTVSQEFADKFNARLAHNLEKDAFMSICKPHEDMLVSPCSFLDVNK